MVWNFLQPLAMILTFTLVFTEIFRDRAVGDTVPYPIFLCSGLLPWSSFSECISRGTNSFIANAIYLRKLPIPEQVFVAQTALSSAINLGLSFSLLILVAAFMGHLPTWHWVLLPIPLVLFIGMGFGIGMLLGTLNAFIRDVGQVLPIVLQVAFWLYPICLKETALPKPMQQLLPLNPVHPFITTIRDLFLKHQVPGPGIWLGMAAWTIVWGWAGYLVLRRLRPELRDVI